MGSKYTGSKGHSGYGGKIAHGSAPKYEGPTIDASGLSRDELVTLCRYVSARTSYGKGAVAPGGDALAWLIRGAGDKNALINAGGYGMSGTEAAAYAALHPSVVALVDGWIAWKGRA